MQFAILVIATHTGKEMSGPPKARPGVYSKDPNKHQHRGGQRANALAQGLCFNGESIGTEWYHDHS